MSVPFFVAKARQVPSCLHEMVFAGRKNMSAIVRMFACKIEEESACSIVMINCSLIPLGRQRVVSDSLFWTV